MLLFSDASVFKSVLRRARAALHRRATAAFEAAAPGAKLPSVAHPDDVGHDIFSASSVTLKRGRVTAVPTGVRMCRCEERHFVKVEGRSGLARSGIFPVGGVIDPAYRGEIVVLLMNASGRDHEVTAGDKIAQLVVYAVGRSQAAELEDERADRGFGSTGSA